MLMLKKVFSVAIGHCALELTRVDVTLTDVLDLEDWALKDLPRRQPIQILLLRRLVLRALHRDIAVRDDGSAVAGWPEHDVAFRGEHVPVRTTVLDKHRLKSLCVDHPVQRRLVRAYGTAGFFRCIDGILSFGCVRLVCTLHDDRG